MDRIVEYLPPAAAGVLQMGKPSPSFGGNQYLFDTVAASQRFPQLVTCASHHLHDKVIWRKFGSARIGAR
jgi:hypothetical protein